MPENAWQESRDTGLRHLSVGVALYAGLCSGFILLYAPAFLSWLGKLWRRPRGLLVICSGRLRRPRQGLGSIKPRTNYYFEISIKRHAPSTNRCFLNEFPSTCGYRPESSLAVETGPSAIGRGCQDRRTTKTQTYVYGKNVLAVLEIHSFLCFVFVLR